jgi:hypothetical protein
VEGITSYGENYCLVVAYEKNCSCSTLCDEEYVATQVLDEVLGRVPVSAEIEH